MNFFVFHSPTRVLFGEGSSNNAPEVMKELHGTRPLIVTDDFLYKSGLLDPILAEVKTLIKEEPIIFTDVPADSEIVAVNKSAKLAADNACDCLIAIGGGSVLDTAKVANICLSLGGELIEHQGLNNLACRLKPLIAIPTTAGTGSEVSMVAMVKDAEAGKKLLFGSQFLAPDAAILDPRLIVSLPPRLTAATGLDAVTHDIESYSSTLAGSPFTEALCLASLRLLFQFLPRATAYGADLEARAATLIASTMAGIAFTNSGVGIVHALAHAAGARFGTHHGATNSIFLPHCMNFNLDVSAPRYAAMARGLKVSDHPNDREAALALIDAVQKLSAGVGLPSRLRDLGVPQCADSQLLELAEAASIDAAMMFNPKEATREDILSIYRKSY